MLENGAELEALGKDVDQLNIEEEKRVNAKRLDWIKQPIRTHVPGSALKDEPRSFGELVVASKSWTGRSMQPGTSFEVDMGEYGMKTLMATTAGWQPRTANGVLAVEKIIRPVQVIDLFPSDRTDLFEIPSMEETTRTQNAAELAEDGTYAEDAFVWTRRSSPVRKVGSQIPVTDEQLDDVPGMQALLNNRLTFGVRARADQQVLVGDGTGVNLTGLQSASGVQTQAKGADATANALLKAATLVRITGRAAPTHVFMHGTDYQNLRLAQNANGDYQFGPPYAAGEDRVWGLPIVQSEALTAGTALVASIDPQWVQIFYRKDIEVSVGYINTQFKIGEKTLRADMRLALWIGRGASVCKVTGL
jgi:HK97 family phage major capsid protein